MRAAAMGLTLGLALAIGGARNAGALEGSGVVLQALDKVTARVTSLEVKLGQPIRFGTLEIVARRCYKRPPEESPESAAFLDIREIRQDELPQQLFTGWMFASSPALSALEHPVYDVWVKDCLNVKSSDDSAPR